MTTLFHSYLFAYVTVLGMALGCLGLLLLHSLVGGAWGNAIRPLLQAGAGTLLWMAALFLPILLGLRFIYPWMDPARYAESFAAGHKHLYFSVPFFALRATGYFALWTWMERIERRQTGNAGLHLVLYVFTVSFASFDWIMSLEPAWASSIYGALVMIGDVLSGLAFAVLMLSKKAKRLRTPVSEDTVHDLGNLLLAFVMLWAYMNLSQYLIIWSGNLPEEIGWYLARQRGGWQWVTILLVLFQFAFPFFLLLARQRKRHLDRLARVAVWILVFRVIDVFWLTVPDFSPGHLTVHVMDIVMLAALLWGWSTAFKSCLAPEAMA